MVSPDGKYVISASDDKTLRLWDIKTGEQIRCFHGHEGKVRSVALVWERNLAISASGDHTLRVWNLEDNRQHRCLKGHQDGVNTVVITPDKRYALSGSADRTVRLWDIETGNQISVFQGHQDEVFAVAMMPNGQHAVSASYDRTLRLWELESQKEILLFNGHEESTPATEAEMEVGISSGISTYNAPSSSVFPVKNRFNRSYRQLHNSGVNAVAILPNDDCAISASDDRTICLWKLKTGKVIRRFKGHDHWVTGLAVTEDGRYIVSASRDCTLRL